MITNQAIDYNIGGNQWAHIGAVSVEQLLYASTGSIIIVARNSNMVLSISHSNDSGVTWSALTPLAAFVSLPSALPWTGQASDANDALATFVSYTNVFYTGAGVSTFTDWPALAR